MAKKPYQGILLEPLPDMLYGPLATDEQRSKDDERTSEALNARWNALCLHYGVEITDSVGLALALATDFVPGFKRVENHPARKRRGQPATVDYYEIGIQVLELVNGGKTKAQAYRLLAKQKIFGDMSAATIERYFKEIQRRTRTEANRRQFFRDQIRRIAPEQAKKWWGEK